MRPAPLGAPQLAPESGRHRSQFGKFGAVTRPVIKADTTVAGFESWTVFAGGQMPAKAVDNACAWASLSPCRARRRTRQRTVPVTNVIGFFVNIAMAMFDPLVIVGGVGLGLLVENRNDRLAFAWTCLLFALLIGLHSLSGLRSPRGLPLGSIAYDATTQTLGALLLAGIVVGIALLVKRR